jgi:group II intron reverse transcriptase/maturase
MQKAEIVLTMLNQESRKDKFFKFKRLYRNLFNMDFYLNAYAKMYSKEGNMTEGVDGETIDGFGLNKVNELMEQIRFERYNPEPLRRTYIPKKNGKLRPLGIPSITDKLIQEVMRQILEAIYEPLFSNNSHGFRPNRSCHTALEQIKIGGNGCAWIIEGDIKGFFDNINHEILLEILKQKIDDGRFINLIGKFLKAGIMEEGKIRNNTTGTPQGGIVSPILANIYLNELDKYMEILKAANWKGKRRKEFKEYRRLSSARHYCMKKANHEKANLILKQMQKLPSTDPMDDNFRRIKYIRYADDFIVLIHGPKMFAEEIKRKIAQYLKENLKLELSMEKTLITNPLTGKARFLGYEIVKGKCDIKIKRTKDDRKCRVVNNVIQFLVPRDIIENKIKKFSKHGKPHHVTERISYDTLSLISTYNSEIRGLYNYYRLANNVSKRIGKYKYYHYYSLVKTLASKHNTSVKKTIKKFSIPVKRKNGTGTINVIGTYYQTKEGKKAVIYFSDSLKRENKPIIKLKIPDDYKKNYKNELIRRLLCGCCELCNEQLEHTLLEVHHVRNLTKLIKKHKNKDGNIPEWVKLMMKIKRKTLVVCRNCHKKIHR